MAKREPKKSKENVLFDEIQENYFDPVNHVLTVFPWGEKGHELENHEPHPWHMDELKRWRDHVVEQEKKVLRGETPRTYKSATGAGHGVGKSAIISMGLHWFHSTRLGAPVNVLANTEAQLRGKTFVEIGKWFSWSENKHWFNVEGLKVTLKPWLGNQLEQQLGINPERHYIEGILWNADRPEGIQGLHSHVGVFVVIDEGSAVPDCIVDAIDPGFFTEKTTSRFFLMFGNVTRNEGAFYDRLFDEKHTDWKTRSIDSRTVPGIDLEEINSLVKKYGEDSDRVRVRVRGLPPKHGEEEQFMSRKLVQDAMARMVEPDRNEALIMAIDPAPRGGRSAAAWRRGLDGSSIEPRTAVFHDNNDLIDWAVDLIHLTDPDVLFIDEGNGNGLIDGLGRLGYGKIVRGVFFGREAQDKHLYFDKRTEIWGRFRDWCYMGSLVKDAELLKEMTLPKSEWVGKGESLEKLESKRKMRGRGISSPDVADAYAMTFTEKVPRKDRRRRRGARAQAVGANDPVFSRGRVRDPQRGNRKRLLLRNGRWSS